MWKFFLAVYYAFPLNNLQSQISKACPIYKRYWGVSREDVLVFFFFFENKWIKHTP